MAQVFLKFDVLNFMAGTFEKKVAIEYKQNDFRFSMNCGQNNKGL